MTIFQIEFTSKSLKHKFYVESELSNPKELFKKEIKNDTRSIFINKAYSSIKNLKNGVYETPKEYLLSDTDILNIQVFSSEKII